MPDEMQWTGMNAAELRTWSGDAFYQPRGDRPAAVGTSASDGTPGWVDLRIGDYVVKHGLGYAVRRLRLPVTGSNFSGGAS